MVAKSAEARKVLRELEKEKAAAAAQLGQSLDWSAADTAILGQISSIWTEKPNFWRSMRGPRTSR